MPVEDHPVHEKTRINADKSYGCWNHKPFNDGYYAPDRVYRPDGTFYIVQTFIPYVMTRECKYDMQEDVRCNNCAWKK